MDQRIIQSKLALKQAFITLLESKEPERITVKELCALAGLNRSTFYGRYGHMDAMIREIISDCVHDVCLGSVPIYDLPNEGTGISRASIRTYIDRFLSNSTLRRFCMLERNEAYQAMIIQIQVAISMRDNETPVTYYPAFFQNAGVLYMLIDWIRNDMSVPEETIVEIIHRFSAAMFQI